MHVMGLHKIRTVDPGLVSALKDLSLLIRMSIIAKSDNWYHCERELSKLWTWKIGCPVDQQTSIKMAVAKVAKMQQLRQLAISGSWLHTRLAVVAGGLLCQCQGSNCANVAHSSGILFCVENKDTVESIWGNRSSYPNLNMGLRRDWASPLTCGQFFYSHLVNGVFLLPFILMSKCRLLVTYVVWVLTPALLIIYYNLGWGRWEWGKDAMEYSSNILIMKHHKRLGVREWSFDAKKKLTWCTGYK